MIKNKEDLKDIQIVCRNEEDVKKCFKMLKELGIEVRNIGNNLKVIQHYYNNIFQNTMCLEEYLKIYFFNKKFIKILKKLINEKKEEEKEKIEDIEVAEDGRIIKINNWESEKEVFIPCNYEFKNSYNIYSLSKYYLDYLLKCGLVYATAEARDRAMFKLQIETKLKNIAEKKKFANL